MLRFFKDFLIYGFASILAKIAAIFLMPLYTNVLTKEEYGVIALITSCKGILDLFSNLNIHSGVARDYYEKRVERKVLVSTGFYSTFIISMLLLVVMTLTMNVWTDNVLAISNYKWPFFLMLLSIPTGSFQLYFAILTRFKKKPILYSIGSLLQLIIQISIAVIGVVVLRKGISSIFLGVLVGEIVAFFFYLYVNKSLLSISFNRFYLMNILKFSLPTLPAIMAGWIDSSMGQIVIGRYISMEDLAVYSVALQFVSVFSLIGGALQNVWSPFLYENYKNDSFKVQSQKIFIAFALILIYITIMLSLFSRDVVILLSNPNYVLASKYIPLLCAPMSLFLLFPFVTSGITISRNTKHIAISYVIGSLFNIIVMILLIPQYKIYAIPIALTVSRLFTYYYMYHVSSKSLNIKFPIHYIVSIILLSIIGYLVTLINITLIYRIALALFITFTFVMKSNSIFKFIRSKK